MKTFSEILHVGIGDRVVIDFSSMTCFTDRPCVFEATVSRIIQRYGRDDFGGWKISPLIYYKDETPKDEAKDKYGIPRSCDVSYVSKIISRGIPTQVFENDFADDSWQQAQVKNISRSSIQGPFHALLFWGLARVHNENLTRPINIGRAIKLWNKSKKFACSKLDIPHEECFEFRDEETFFVATVNKKKWLKWVRKNWHQILTTSTEFGDTETEANHNMNEDYWADAENDQDFLY